jgi:acetate kinase
MRVLVVNAGSSTLKLRLLDATDDLLASCDIDPWIGETDTAELEAFLERVDHVDAIGHRVVHGGEQFVEAVRLDDRVLEGLTDLISLAPLHQPRALAGIRATAARLPDVPAVACFDTAYHATLSAAAATYALPRAWRERWPLRRFGFHGLSHAYAARRAAELIGRSPDDLRVVTCHLGAGASLCATDRGRSVDTTMGFTPLEGLVMATRSGSVDPGLVCWLVEQGGLPVADVTHGLSHASGLAGLAGLPGGSGDLRDVLEALDRGDGAARLAFDVYAHRLRREIGAMVASLGGLDVLVFTGGVGEHQPRVRHAAAAGLGFLGVAIDDDRSAATTADGEISPRDAGVRTLVVTAREDIEIARQVRRVCAEQREHPAG